MKRYAVIKKIDGMASSASVCREFDNIDDARMYKNLCAVSETGHWQYYVVEVLEQHLFHCFNIQTASTHKQRIHKKNGVKDSNVQWE